MELECWSAGVLEYMRRTLAPPWEQLCGASRGAREREPDRIVGALGAAAGAGASAERGACAPLGVA